MAQSETRADPRRVALPFFHLLQGPQVLPVGRRFISDQTVIGVWLKDTVSADFR
jgi:hypothetical protein